MNGKENVTPQIAAFHFKHAVLQNSLRPKERCRLGKGNVMKLKMEIFAATRAISHAARLIHAIYVNMNVK